MFLAPLLCLAASAADPPPRVKVDADFPGGNIVVDEVEGDVVKVHQDIRDTMIDWFYWYFRVTNAAGRRLRLEFTGSAVIGPLGPAVSLDRGRTWSWLGAGSVRGRSFEYSFPPNAGEVRFSMGMPYLERNWREFLTRQRVKDEVLCRSEKGRKVEMLRLGRRDKSVPHRVLLTARHHSCEMMASYALEGIVESILARDDDGRWLRKNAGFLIVPFMDKDGVEDGDQGKVRRPQDHNRDYQLRHWASVRALQDLVANWSQGQVEFALDLHCPGLNGPSTLDAYFVAGPGEHLWKGIEEYSNILVNVRRGPLPFDPARNLRYGKGWNTGPERPGWKSFNEWVAGFPGARFGCSMELPYAQAGGVPVTAESARALGRDMARALRRFLDVASTRNPQPPDLRR